MAELEVAALTATDPRSIAGYVLRGRLGEGGMGVVYLADRPGGESAGRAALKVIRSDIASDAEFVRRFEREVTSTQAVRSDAVAAFIDSGVDNGTPWLAIAYHPGLTLKDWVAQHGPLDADQVEVLARGLLVGLTDIHRVGLVHRDLKPSNVLLTSDGPVIIDFGVALATEGTSITRTGRAVGSPGWMAPEQVTGGDIYQAVDIFGWASIVQYAATGESPFGKGRPEAQLYRVRHAAPAPHGLGGVLGQMVTAGLAKEAHLRPDAATIAAALDSGRVIGVDADNVESDAPFTRLDLPVEVVVVPLEKPRSPLVLAALITLVVAVGVALLVATVGSGVTAVAGQAGLDENSAASIRTSALPAADGEGDEGGSESAPIRATPTAAPECVSGSGAAYPPEARPVPDSAARNLFGSIWPGALLAVPSDAVVRDVVTLGDGRVAMITFSDAVAVWDPSDPLASIIEWEPLAATAWMLASVGTAQIAVGLDNGTVAIVDADEPTADPVLFEAHDDRIVGLVGLCDGRVVAKDTDSSSLAVIDLATGEVDQVTVRLDGPIGGISGLARLSDGRVAVAGFDDAVFVVDLAPDVGSLDRVKALGTDLKAGITHLHVLDDDVIVAIDTDGEAEAWRAEGVSSLAARRVGPDEWLGATATPLVGGRLAIGSRFGAARVWHPATDRIVELDAGQVEGDRPIVVNDENRELVTTPSGHVIAASLDGIMRVWPTGARVDDMPVIVAPAAVVALDDEQIASLHELTLLGDGKIAAVGSAVRVIDVQASIASSANPLASITSVAASAELIAVARQDGRLSVLADGELVLDVDGQDRRITALAVDGETVIAASVPASVGQGPASQESSRVSLIATDETTSDVTVDGVVTVVHPLRDQSGAFALGFENGTVSLLDRDGSVSLLFDAAESAVVAIDQLDDGRLVVGADDSRFWLLDTSTLEVTTVDHPYGSPAPLTVWGQQIVTAGGSGRFRLWDPLDPDSDPQVVETGRHVIVGFTEVGGRLVAANSVGDLRTYERDGSLVAARDLSRGLVTVTVTGAPGLEEIVAASESGATALKLFSDDD